MKKDSEEMLEMKKNVLVLVLAVVLTVCGCLCGGINVNAQEVGEDMEFSYLLTEEALVGYMVTQSRGVYLMNGNSIINKISSTKIGAGGTTTASIKCKVSITSIVEKETSSGWVRVTSWTQTNENAFSAMLSKSLTVGTGYYYRVRSSHYAASDVSSSYTDALRM